MTTELATTTPQPPAAASGVLVPSSDGRALLRPLAAPAEVIAQQNMMREYVRDVLEEGRDYGNIPGTNKPVLLKPGAERLNAGFGIVARFTILTADADHDIEVPWIKRKKVFARGTWTGDWTEEHGVGIGRYRYVVRCDLYLRGTPVLVGTCDGVCSTMESKYIDRPRDSENTVLKMAQKRALVGAVLLCYGLSDEFTQDMEDHADAGVQSPPDGGGGEVPAVPTPNCPKCGKPMKDQRVTKKNPKAPDWKCTSKVDGEWCNEVYWPGQWPPKDAAPAAAPTRDTPVTFGGEQVEGLVLRDVPAAVIDWWNEALEKRVPEAWRALVKAEPDARAFDASERRIDRDYDSRPWEEAEHDTLA